MTIFSSKPQSGQWVLPVKDILGNFSRIKCSFLCKGAHGNWGEFIFLVQKLKHAHVVIMCWVHSEGIGVADKRQKMCPVLLAVFTKGSFKKTLVEGQALDAEIALWWPDLMTYAVTMRYCLKLTRIAPCLSVCDYLLSVIGFSKLLPRQLMKFEYFKI